MKIIDGTSIRIIGTERIVVPRPLGIELTRRNLQALLAKLDEPDSKRTLFKDGFFVTAVEDDTHYADRQPGPVSAVTQAAIDRMRGV